MWITYHKDSQLKIHQVDIHIPVFAVLIHYNILPRIQDLGDELKTKGTPRTSVSQCVRIINVVILTCSPLKGIIFGCVNSNRYKYSELYLKIYKT